MSVRALADLIRQDWQANFRDWTLPGFRALAVYRFGRWAHQLRFRPVRAVLVRVHRTMFRFVRNYYGIELPVTASIGRNIIIGHQGGIVVHRHAVIGDDCFLRQNVTIGGTRVDRGNEAPTLGKGVSVGCGAVIVGGITIGDNANIGPNVVVISDVPPGAALFAGTPRMLTFGTAPVRAKAARAAGE
jgi:serine O-acetyltransferase